MNLKKTRGLRYVRRFNFHFCNNYQNVAEHSYYVAVIASEISLMYIKEIGIGLEFVYKCVHRALFHDIDESITGDIPHMVKRVVDVSNLIDHAMKEIDYSEEFGVDPIEEGAIEDIVKFADKIELKLYLEEERKSGNHHLYRIEQETYKLLLDTPIIMKIKKHFIDMLEYIEPLDRPENISHEGM